MLITGILLLVVDVVLLLRYLVWNARRLPRWVDWLPLLALVAMGGHFLASAWRSPLTILFALPAYAATSALFLLTVPRAFRRGLPPPAARWRGLKMAASAVGLVLVLFSAVRVAQFHALEKARPRFESLHAEPRQTDLRHLSWGAAFNEMAQRLAAEYPFTEWRGLDWAALRNEFAPRIARAEAEKDATAYYHALREFAWRIPDGHIQLMGSDRGLQQAETGGSYGFTAVELADGRIVVARVEPGGPAEQAGIAFGAELLAWNGAPIREALARVPVIWSDAPPATSEGKKLVQLRFLPRAPAGAQAVLSYRQRGEAQPRSATLTARKAPPEPLAFNLARELLLRTPFETKTLSGDYGYIRIRYELPTLLCVNPERMFAREVSRLQQAGARGLILDVRGNIGGQDVFVAELAGHFYRAPRVYEHPGVLNRATGRFQAVEREAVRIVPAEPYWGGPVVVLVDAGTLSSGEGLPLVLKGLPNVTLVGWQGTYGSFAINQKEILLPDELRFIFPQAQSLDAAHRIQVDSDAGGRGGVAPDVRVTLDEAALDAAYRDGRDVVLEAALQLLRQKPATQTALTPS